MNEYLRKQLREGRLNKNLKQSDVTKLTGIKNTTLSNYENGVTEPDIDTFLQLCELYELDYAEILGEAYGLSVQGTGFNIKPSEIEMVKKYRELDSHGIEMVDFTLEKEWERCTAAVPTVEYKMPSEKVLLDFVQDGIVAGYNDNYYQPNAAHSRNDIEIEESVDTSEDHIMDDEEF